MLKSCFQEGLIEAGCDEAGRGCLAGPVVAAAVILPAHFEHPALNDSKQLSEAERNNLRDVIEKHALHFAVTMVDHKEIDEVNILQASYLAIHRSLDKLDTRIDLILVDGNRFKPYKAVDHECIVKGDGKYASIAAASILAKTYRDEYMQALHKKHPEYYWARNKGYPTADHRRAIAEHGPSPFHRMSFKLLPEAEQLSLEL